MQQLIRITTKFLNILIFCVLDNIPPKKVIFIGGREVRRVKVQGLYSKKMTQ
jgi:hypothetical protein